MKNFIKKQINKLLIYLLMLTILLLVGNIFKISIFNLVSIWSFITSIFGIFLGKTWIEDYKLEINKELEKNKSELSKELEKYKTKLSSYTLVTKLQYDLEFKIYTEIYEKMFLLYIETDKLMPVLCNADDLTNENIQKRLNSFSVIYNETSNSINKYRPFYSKEIYEILKETRDICHKESIATQLIIQNIGINFNYAASMVRKDKIKENLEKISEVIRNRIKNMKIIED